MELNQYPLQGKIRHFRIEAIQIPIVYNKYGDHDPDGLLYVLEEDAERVKKGALQNYCQRIPQPYEGVKPLVIRVNLGDEVHVRFRHSLHRRLSIHVQGMRYDVASSDGANVGWNPDSTTAREICYTWYAQKEGGISFSWYGGRQEQ